MKKLICLLMGLASLFSMPLYAANIYGSLQDANGPIAYGSVRFYDSAGNYFIDVGTDGNGDFDSGSLPDDSYYVLASASNTYFDDIWDGVDGTPCMYGVCGVVATGTPIVISGGQSVSGIDFILDPLVGATMSGYVKDDGNNAIANMQLLIFAVNGEQVESTMTDANGDFQTGLLANGTYYMRTYQEPFGLGTQFYDGVNCYSDCYNPAVVTASTPIVLSGSDVTGINFNLSMPPGNMISGQITDDTLGRIITDYVELALFDEYGSFQKRAYVDSTGKYYFSGLADGNYKVLIEMASGYAEEIYDDIPCEDYNCDIVTQGTLITLSGNDALNTDFALTYNGSPRISGTVTAEVGGMALSDIQVCVARRDGSFLGCNITNENGHYSVTGLPSEADLVVLVDSTNGQPYKLETYLDKGPHDYSNGTGVDISVHNAAGIDFVLASLLNISGTMRDESNNPIAEGRVHIWDSVGNLVNTAYNQGNGNYTTQELPAGTYYATAYGEDWGRVSELWQGISCPQEYCDLINTGTPIVLSTSSVSGVDFNLEPQYAVATISGSLRDINGQPVYGSVRFYDPSGNFVDQANVDGNADFVSNLLPDGSYFVVTRYANGFFDDVWDGADGTPCMYELCGVVSTGTPIVISGGQSVSGIDFILDPLVGATISGHVEDASNNPLGNVQLLVYAANGEQATNAITDTNGDFITEQLADGTYYIRTYQEPFGLGTQFYDGIDCHTDCNNPTVVTASTPIVLSGSDVTGIDFSLTVPPGNMISGQLTDELLGSVIYSYADLGLYDEFGGYLANTVIDSTGHYYFSGLADGNYKVSIGYAEGYAEELYDNIPCENYSCDIANQGTLISLNSSDAPNTDFSLTYNGPPRISGNVTAEVGGMALSNIQVCVARRDGSYLNCATTDSNGDYSVTNLPAESDLVVFIDYTNGQPYSLETYDNKPPYDYANGTGVDISVNNAVGIDFTLPPLLTISGVIMDEFNNPISDGSVHIWDSLGNQVSTAYNQGNGNYETDNLTAGTYYATAVGESWGRVSQLWQGISCPQEYCDIVGMGTPIVLSGASISGVDFNLEPISAVATISGSLQDTRGLDVFGIVRLYDPFGNYVDQVATDGFGNFVSNPLPDGTYFAVTRDTLDYYDDVWDGVDGTPCMYELCGVVETGAPIVISGGQSVTDIHFILDDLVGGRISGFVMDASSNPLSDVQINFYAADGRLINGRVTNANGEFITPKLADGTYYLSTYNEPYGLARQFYNGIDCFSNCDDPVFVTSTTPVVVSGGDVTGINFNLSVPAGNMISGQLTDDVLGVILNSNANVQLLDSSGGYLKNTSIDSDGRYYFSGLADGNYKVFVDYASGYALELYDDIPCDNYSCNPSAEGTVITLTGQDALDIDFALSYIGGPRITGQVLSETGGLPLANIEVCAARRDGWPLRCATTNDQGMYALMNLPLESDLIAFVESTNGQPYLREAFDNQVYGNWANANGIDLSVNGASGIDFALADGYIISGHLLDADNGTYIPESVVHFYDANHNYINVRAFPNFDGSYVSEALPAGEYHIKGSATGYMDQLWDGINCRQYCDISLGDTLNLNAHVVNIDFNLSMGGTISGTVLDAATLQPLQGVTIVIENDQGWFLQTLQTDQSGHYAVENLPNANYYLRADVSSHISQIYNGINCITDCINTMSVLGTAVSITANGQLVSDIDFSLDTGGTISGSVTEAVTGDPISQAFVYAYLPSGEMFKSAQTDINGFYTMGGLIKGAYFLETNTDYEMYLDTWYGGQVCQLNKNCIPNKSGTPVLINGLTDSVTEVDFQLGIGGAITGTILLEDNSYYDGGGNVRVELFDINRNLLRQGFQYYPFETSYQFLGLAPGTYYAVFASSTSNNGAYYPGREDQALIDTAYGGLPCPRGSCDLSLTVPITVKANQTTAGIDGKLSWGPVMKGTLTDTLGNPVADSVYVHNDAGLYAAYGNTDASGNWVLRTGLPPGTYYLSTFAHGRSNLGLSKDLNLVDELYDDIECAGGCDVTLGTPVTVSNSVVTGLDIQVSEGGTISGQVSDSNGPLSLVTVTAYDVAGHKVVEDVTGILGQYSLRGLPVGTYYLVTHNNGGYTDEVYDNLICDPFCNPTIGAPIVINSPGQTVNSIDFELAVAGSISGSLIYPNSSVADGESVEVYNAIGEYVSTTITDGNGDFSVQNLTAGNYYARSKNMAGYVDVLYQSKRCVGNACEVTNGTVISVSSGNDTQLGVLQLENALSLGGRVIDDSSLQPISATTVALYNSAGDFIQDTLTDSAGGYQFNGLLSGNYYVVTRGTPGYVDEAFGDVVCGASCSATNGSVVSLVGDRNDIDFALGSGVTIFGSVKHLTAGLIGIRVQLYDSSGLMYAEAMTDASGQYTLNTIPDGMFYLRTKNNNGYIDQAYNGYDCDGFCDVTTATEITISGSAVNIDFNLLPGGAVSGNINDGMNGLSSITVQIYDEYENLITTKKTDALGHYYVSGLTPGNYYLKTAANNGYINQLYGGQRCGPEPCLFANATQVNVTTTEVTGIDFALDFGQSFSGTATDAFNNPLPTGTAVLYDAIGTPEIVLETPIVSGNWQFKGVANGDYYLLILNGSGLVDQLYSEVPCPAGSCDIASLGTTITLNSAPAPGTYVNPNYKILRSTGSINFVLDAGVAFYGSITDALTAEPVNQSVVTVLNSNGSVAGKGVANALGEYTTDVTFPPGDYYLRVEAEQKSGLINELYNDIPCPVECDLSMGSLVSVIGFGADKEINFELDHASRISGQVNLSGASTSLAGSLVELYDANGFLVGQSRVGLNNRYAIEGLLSGTYYAVLYSINDNVKDVLYGGAICQPNCDVLTGNPIELASQQDLTDIDFDVVYAPDSYFIGVTVTGLAEGNVVEFSNNGADNMLVNTNDVLTYFSTPLNNGDGYEVVVTTQPTTPNQNCTVENGVGVVNGQDIELSVTCANQPYYIGGLVSGLVSGNYVTLSMNSGDEYLLVDNNDTFVFINPLPDASGYDVAVASNPTTPNQTCSVTNGSGIVMGADVTNIEVICELTLYFVGGYVNGLIPNNYMVLQNNLNDDLVVRGEGPFVFDTPMNNFENYAVSIQTQPVDPIQTCEVLQGDGTFVGQDVSSVLVNCEFGDDLIYRHGFDTPDAISRAVWEPRE